MPLFLASPLSLAANIIGIILWSYTQLYGLVTIITIVQSIFHFLVILAQRNFSFKNSSHFTGFLVYYNINILESN